MKNPKRKYNADGVQIGWTWRDGGKLLCAPSDEHGWIEHWRIHDIRFDGDGLSDEMLTLTCGFRNIQEWTGSEWLHVSGVKSDHVDDWQPLPEVV